MLKRNGKWVVFLVCLTFVGTCVGITSYDRVQGALALRCAKKSDGTDDAIAKCYARYDLPVPDDI